MIICLNGICIMVRNNKQRIVLECLIYTICIPHRMSKKEELKCFFHLSFVSRTNMKDRYIGRKKTLLASQLCF